MRTSIFDDSFCRRLSSSSPPNLYNGPLDKERLYLIEPHSSSVIQRYQFHIITRRFRVSLREKGNNIPHWPCHYPSQPLLPVPWTTARAEAKQIYDHEILALSLTYQNWRHYPIHSYSDTPDQIYYVVGLHLYFSARLSESGVSFGIGTYRDRAHVTPRRYRIRCFVQPVLDTPTPGCFKHFHSLVSQYISWSTLRRLYCIPCSPYLHILKHFRGYINKLSMCLLRVSCYMLPHNQVRAIFQQEYFIFHAPRERINLMQQSAVPEKWSDKSRSGAWGIDHIVVIIELKNIWS